MSDLTDFLLARIADDEAVAKAAVARNGAEWLPEELSDGTRITGTTEFGNPRSYRASDELWDDEGAMGMFAETAAHVTRWDPARVLVECEAKRRIVELHAAAYNEGRTPGTDGRPCGVCSEWDREWPCRTLRLLAQPYADHPEFREEWRP